MTGKKDELMAEIRAAFSWRPYPGDSKIALRRPEFPGYEGEDVQRFFQGKDWREVTLKSIMNKSGLDPNAFVFFLRAEGFVYFLPAFLVISLCDDDPIAFDETLSFALTPPPDKPGTEAWGERFSEIAAALTSEEKKAVVHVLEYLADKFDQDDPLMTNLARGALDGYWGQFLDI